MCVLQGNNQTIEEIENGRSKEKNVEDEKTSADCGEQLRGRSGELLRELHFDCAYRFFLHETDADLHRAHLLLRAAPQVYTLCTGAIQNGNAQESLLSLEGSLSFSALKPAEDGDGAILRLVNLSGEPAQATVRLSAPHRITACNLAEEPSCAPTDRTASFRPELPPWTIGSWRIS